MDDNLKQQLLFEANRKSTGASYVLWFFLGGLGAHRFYLGRHVSGVLQLMLALFGWLPFAAGWIVLGLWWLLDAFLIPDMVRKANVETIHQIDAQRRDTRIDDARPVSRRDEDRDYRGPSRSLPRYR